MGIFEQPVLLMALALVMAIGIERLLELIRAVEDYREARNGTIDRWQRIAEKVRNRIEVRLEIAKGSDPTTFQKVLMVVCRYLSPAPAGTAGLIAISTDQVRSLSIRLLCKLYGIALGIALAHIFQLDLFALVNAAIHQGDGYEITLPTWLGILLSGITMGLGASPVHKLIVALERVRKNKL